jgi:hypothetical protein
MKFYLFLDECGDQNPRHSVPMIFVANSPDK